MKIFTVAVAVAIVMSNSAISVVGKCSKYMHDNYGMYLYVFFRFIDL